MSSVIYCGIASAFTLSFGLISPDVFTLMAAVLRPSMLSRGSTAAAFRWGAGLEGQLRRGQLDAGPCRGVVAVADADGRHGPCAASMLLAMVAAAWCSWTRAEGHGPCGQHAAGYGCRCLVLVDARRAAAPIFGCRRRMRRTGQWAEPGPLCGAERRKADGCILPTCAAAQCRGLYGGHRPMRACQQGTQAGGRVARLGRDPLSGASRLQGLPHRPV